MIHIFSIMTAYNKSLKIHYQENYSHEYNVTS